MAGVVSSDSARHNAATKAVQDSILADLTALATAITTLTAQLDADAGVTDTDYAANCDPTLELT